MLTFVPPVLPSVSKRLAITLIVILVLFALPVVVAFAEGSCGGCVCTGSSC